jgi:cytochrome b561
MRATNSTTSWGWAQRLLHWTMAGLILFMIGLGLWMVEIDDVFEAFGWYQLHKSWGFVVFALALVRVAWRWVQPAKPTLPKEMPGWERAAAEGAHIALYVLLFALPISGWLMASASPLQDQFGVKNMVFGLVEMPDVFIPGDKALEGALKSIHSTLAWALVILLVGHVAGALKHHFVTKDDVLKRMTFGA